MTNHNHFDHCELQYKFNALKLKIVKNNPTAEEWNVERMTWDLLTLYINECVDVHIMSAMDSDSEEDK